MKKLALALVFILAVMPLSALAAEPYDFLHVSGCDSWISLRAMPSRSAERLAKIPLGALVKYISEANDEFLEIQYASMRGYALRSYLSEGSFFDMYNVPMYVRPDAAMVYASASTETEPVAELKKGDMVSCISKIGDDDGTMALVRYNGVEGCMLMTDMTFFRDIAVPVITDAVMIVPDDDAGLIYQPISCNGKSCEGSAAPYSDEHLAFHMQEIAAMLDRAEPGITCQGPVGAQLVLKIDDGDGETSYLCFMLPLDGCPILIAENLVTYQLSETDGQRLWEIFGEVWQDSCISAN